RTLRRVRPDRLIPGALAQERCAHSRGLRRSAQGSGRRAAGARRQSGAACPLPQRSARRELRRQPGADVSGRLGVRRHERSDVGSGRPLGRGRARPGPGRGAPSRLFRGRAAGGRARPHGPGQGPVRSGVDALGPDPGDERQSGRGLLGLLDQPLRAVQAPDGERRVRPGNRGGPRRLSALNRRSATAHQRASVVRRELESVPRAGNNAGAEIGAAKHREDLSMQPCRTIGAAALIAAFGLAGGANAQVPESEDPIKLTLHDWTGQLITTEIMGRVLQSMGYNVEYVQADYIAQFAGLESGDLHVAMEMWETTGKDAMEASLATGKTVDLGETGMHAIEEWWYPAYMKEQCPG